MPVWSWSITKCQIRLNVEVAIQMARIRAGRAVYKGGTSEYYFVLGWGR